MGYFCFLVKRSEPKNKNTVDQRGAAPLKIKSFLGLGQKTPLWATAPTFNYTGRPFGHCGRAQKSEKLRPPKPFNKVEPK
jgi:hypothetical protein